MLSTLEPNGGLAASPPVVLLVGDSQDSLAMYALGLLAMGFHPVTADTADEGFERACRFHPQAIVVDVALTGTSALRLSRRVRSDARTSDMAILVLSNDARTSTMEDLTKAGCDRVVRKPCAPDVLAAEVHHALESRRHARRPLRVT